VNCGLRLGLPLTDIRRIRIIREREKAERNWVGLFYGYNSTLLIIFSDLLGQEYTGEEADRIRYMEG
jgi:hypothetical protein